MKLTTKGIKATDRSIEVQALNLFHGKNGEGKSTITQALQFLALGHVPSLGKREADTAALMRESSMEVELSLDDGRTMRRSLHKTDKGSYQKGADVSWLRNAKPTEVSKEILNQFGEEELDVAEVMDIRQLLSATPNQRTARVEQLLESGKRPVKETVEAVARLTVMRLIPGLREENMPKQAKDAMGMVSDAQKKHLYANAKLISDKITEAGIAGAMAWANEEKKRSSTGLQQQEQAAHAMRLRAVEVPEPIERDIQELEEKRDTLLQEIGTAEALTEEYETRSKAILTLKDRIIEAEEAFDRTGKSLAEAVNTYGDSIEDLKAKSQKALRDLEALKAPTAPDMAPLRALEKEIEALHDKRDAIELPTVPDPTDAVYAVKRVEDEIKRAKGSPWSEVLEIALKIKKSGDQKTHAARLEKIAREALGVDVEGLEHDLEHKKAVMKDAVAASEAARKDRAEKEAEREEIEREAAEKAVQRERLRTKLNEGHVKALAEFDAKKRQLLADRQAFEREIAVGQRALELARQNKDATERRLASLKDQLKGMGALPDKPAAAPEELQQQLQETKEAHLRLTDARAVHKEIQAALARIEEMKAERDVFAAIEWGLQRQREIELNDAGGPLLKHTAEFLEAAGRKEKPFIRANGIGWKDQDGREVLVQALSGGEWALFAAALTSAVLICRTAPIKVLIVEAGETDQTTLQQILRGVEASKDELTAAFVLTPFPPAKVPKAWNVVNLVNEPVAA